MATNPVQFQPSLSMVEFMRQYRTEAKYYRALYRASWPQGFRCPLCNERQHCRFRRVAQVYYQCHACRHQTMLLSGAVFQGTKLLQRTWMLAIHLLTSTKTNVAALELMRNLEVNYRVAWRIKHKIMQAMAKREAPRQLFGLVQIDDAYLGGEFNGGKPGRESPNNQALLIAVETDGGLEHPAHVVTQPVRGFDDDSIKDWQARYLAPDAEVFSDGLYCFRRFADAGHAHTVLETAGGRAACEVRGARWVNALQGNVKRAISGSYHAIRQGKYARCYLAEAAYRFNRRFRLRGMLPRLARAMTLCEPWPEPKLRAVDDFHS